MSTILKRSTLNFAAASALTLSVATSALAASGGGTVGGAIAEINTLTSTPVSSIVVVAATGQTDTIIVSGTINNNMEAGWNLTVASANNGYLYRGDGGAGNQILYTNVKMVETGGTLGTGLAFDGSNQPVTADSATFSSTTDATSATVDYDFDLKISWDSDVSLLEGTYSDSITLTLSTDT